MGAFEICEREVEYWNYCDTCKYKDLDDTQEPCNECLGNPITENTSKPIKYEKG